MKQLLLFLFISTTQIIASVQMEVMVTPNQLSVGDLFLYKIKLTAPVEYKLTSVPDKNSFANNAYEWVDSDIKKSQTDQTRHITLQYLFRAFAVDSLTIPTQSISFQVPNETTPIKEIIKPYIIPIQSVIQSKEQAGILISNRLYKETLDWKQFWFFWVLVMVGILLFVILTVILIRKIQRKPTETPVIKEDPRSFKEIALDNLDKLYKKNLFDSAQHKDHYVQYSEIIKWYIGKMSNLECVEKTTHEIGMILKKKFTESRNKKIKSLLTFSDQIKFAKQVPSAEEHNVYQKLAVEIINDLWLYFNATKQTEDDQQ